MLKKVVPESLVPQNIITFLMDETAQLPEPDAFTFLNRLRGLGIGSADFLYLLEGCGAPEAAVEKIRANPAMNLQGLIMTLEGSGMTSKDYTRILYTARQIWERTLTLRLETSAAAVTAEDESEQAYQEGGTDQNIQNVQNVQYAQDEEPSQAAEAAEEPVKAPVSEADAEAEADSEDQLDKEEAPLPHTKSGSPYPDATEELMSVDFGAEYHFGDTTVIDVQKGGNADGGSEAAKDNSNGSFGIGSGGAVDLFGGEAVDGELGYSRSFAESFVNDYMVDFAEDDLADSGDDEYDPADEFGGTYYGDFERYTDEIPAVGSKKPDAGEKKLPEKPSDSIPDAREPFEVHIASYDIPEEPDEFELARSKDKETDNGSAAGTSDESEDGSGFEFVSENEFTKKNTATFEVKIDYGDEDNGDNAENTPAAPEKGGYNGDTSMLIPIDKDAIEQNISSLEAEEKENERTAEHDIRTAAQKPSPKTAKQAEQSDGDIYEDEFDFDDDFDDDRKSKSGWKKGAVIAAGVGAAVLVGANFAVMAFINGQKNKNEITYAEDHAQIFAEIYYSHADGIAGGGDAAEYRADYSKVFGDLLICGNGLGAFTAGDCVYNVSETKITASSFKNGELTELGRIEPGDGMSFVAAFENGDSLIAVYNSKYECGYLSIKGGETVYTVRQSGQLTDFRMENGAVGIGSVYTPTFNLPNGEDRFGADNTDIYLPKVGTGYRIIDPKNVVLSKTRGYSYALSASYSLEGGTVVSSRAALGNPVYASADNLFVMNGSETKKNVTEEYGLLIYANAAADPVDTENEPLYERIGKVGCAASSGNMIAVYEGGKIVLRSPGEKGFNEISTLNIGQAPSALRFSDNYLTASDGENIFLTVDCSGTAVSEEDVLRLRRINGDCDGSSAITLEADDNGIKLTRYVLENGAAKAVASFVRELTAAQKNTLVCGSANTMTLTADRVGAAYSYFDGVSVISEYVTLSDSPETATLFDDKTGFEYAFVSDGKIYAVCSKGAVDVVNYTEPDDSDNEDDGGSGDNGDGDGEEDTPRS